MKSGGQCHALEHRPRTLFGWSNGMENAGVQEHPLARDAFKDANLVAMGEVASEDPAEGPGHYEVH